MRFEFAERHLDWIEVWRVLRQIAQYCTNRLNRFLHARNLVGRKIVHHDHVVALERRSQALLDIGQETRPIDWSINDHRRHHPIMAQGGHERDRLPMSVRNVTDQSLAAQAASPETDHVGAGRSLIDEHQPRRIKKPLLANPPPTRSRHVGAMLLGCPQAFF
jgi:hypothetical protein